MKSSWMEYLCYHDEVYALINKEVIVIEADHPMQYTNI